MAIQYTADFRSRGHYSAYISKPILSVPTCLTFIKTFCLLSFLLLDQTKLTASTHHIPPKKKGKAAFYEMSEKYITKNILMIIFKNIDPFIVFF